MLAAALMSLALAQTQAATPAPLEIDVWNDIPADVTFSVPGGAPAHIARNKEGDFNAPGGGKSLTVSYRGCDYPFTLPDSLESYREEEQGGAARFYLWDGPVLYVVPPDLDLQSPINYLDPKQPIGFPLYPGKGACRTP